MTQRLPPIYLVSAARTPIGAFLGSLSTLRAPELGKVAIAGALERAKLAPDAVEEVFFGNVLTAGIGQAPARQAAIYAGIPNTVPATTIGKVCGSGMQAVIFGAKTIAVGDADLVVAGGMESMSNAPYYLEKARSGYRMGDGKLVDGMIFDGLWDPYGNVHMGSCGDRCAAEYGFTREQQDDHAKESFRRALAAQKEGLFDAEIAPVSVAQRKGDPLVVRTDEGPAKGDPAKFASLKPAFSKDGTVTAANASSLNDGASAAGPRERGGGQAARPAADGAHRRVRRRGSSSRMVHDGPREGHRRHAGASSASPRTRSTSTRSTRHSRSSPSRSTSCAGSTRPASTSAAARWRSATPSARPARAS